jgi:diguanylate cyclase (GGDEF)-like protein
MGDGAGRTSQTSSLFGPSAGGVGRSRRQRRVWTAVAALVLIGGTAGSVFAAGMVARGDADRSHRGFVAASADIASTLNLAILHEDDLIVSGAAYLSGNPDGSNAQFLRWANSVQALSRYPELQDFGNAVIVPASQLKAFAARAQAHPWAPLGPNGTFQVVPPGRRASYCFGTVGQVRNAKVGAPDGYDFCATGLGPALYAARDSGQGSYAPFTVGANLELGVSTPIYRGGVVPRTVEQRREAFLGWFGTSIVPKVLLDEALENHPHTTVTFRYHADGSNAVFQSGTIRSGAQSVSIDLYNGWTVKTFAVISAGGLLADGSALRLLLAGIALSALVAALVFVLATGRARALRVIGEQTEELRHQALHDTLTDLSNRALITDRIEQLFARNRRNHTIGAALYIDLDEFKNVNDTLGHDAGDQLLQAVATRLTTSLRDADTIGRIGGDEFVVLIDGASMDIAPELVAERILEVMRQPFEIQGASMPMVVTTSIGIAVGDRDTAGHLLRDADVALYQAKAAGKNCYEVFRPDMHSDAKHRVELEFDLRAALEGGQFHLVYQPIYDLNDLTLIGVEALIRWAHPTLGEIQPDEFIPLLETSGQIVDVGRWVLHEACNQTVAWRDRGNDLTMSVNVSGRQLDHDVIVDDVHEALETSGLDPSMLTIEITETALMRNVDRTARRLRQLKDLGVKVAIDDFGTGYSSLAYLQKFPVDCLKIDRAFTNAITHSPEANALIHTLVQLGKDLGLKTLAEGVETTGQLDQLRNEHVNEAQGFLLARPLAPQTLETQLLEPTRPPTPTGPLQV